jgi:hypothetical protein
MDVSPPRITLSFPEVSSRDGHRVPAILLEPPAPRGGAALCHGYGGSKEEVLGLALAFALRGCITLAIGHSLGGRLALMSDADLAIGFSPSVVRGISATGQTMMTTFTSPRVREDHPGYLLEIVQAMPPIPDDGKRRFIVHSEKDVPGILAGLEALSLRNLERVSVKPLYTEPATDPRLLAYLPIWFNHADMKLNPEAVAQALAWLDRPQP